MKKLAISNQKGGEGKTTIAVHVAYAALEAGLRVLLVDLDRQGSLSLSFPPTKGAEPGMTASLLFSSAPVELQPEKISDQMSIIRADSTLAQISGEAPGIEKRPAMQLRRFEKDFDLCIIDTPGVIGFNPPMTVAALVAADGVVCPFGVGLYESASLAELWSYLKSIKTPKYNPRLRLMGLLPSKVNTKSKEEIGALEALREQFGAVIFPGMLAYRASVKQSIMRRRPVWQNTKGAGHLAAAKEWRAVCNQILGKLGE